jgi:hypothetical protein
MIFLFTDRQKRAESALFPPGNSLSGSVVDQYLVDHGQATHHAPLSKDGDQR